MAQQKMHCALRRTHCDSQKVADGGKGPLSRKSLEQEKFRTSSKVSEIPSATWTSTDQRCTVLTFLAPEPNGNWRVVALPLQYFDDTNRLGSGSQVNMDGLHLVSPRSINSFKIDQRKAQKLPPPNATCSVKSFAARNFPAPNVRHQPRNKTLANKMTKLDEFSNNSTCQGSLTSSGSSALIPKGSNASDRIIDSSRENKAVKRNTRKKGKRKGKQNRHSCEIGPTEPEVLSEEYTLGSSPSETLGNNDMDHTEGLVSCATSPEASFSDDKDIIIDFEGNSNGVINCSESPKKCRSCIDEVDVSEAMIPSIVQKFPQEHSEIGIQADQKFSIFDGRVEGTHRSEITCYDDMSLRGFSDARDTLLLDSVSIGSNSDDSGNASHDIFDNESHDTSLSEPPDFNSRKREISRSNLLNDVVDICGYTAGKKHGGQGFSGNGVQVVAPGKRGKDFKAVPRSSSVNKIGSLGGSHGGTGKENNHVWQRVQRNDATECNSELKKASSVCSQFNATLKHADLVKRNFNVPEINALSKNGEKKQLKDEANRKLERKISPGSNQEFNSYSRRGSHPNKAGSDGHGKINMQKNEILDIATPVDNQNGLSDVSETCSGIVTNRVEGMSSESGQSSQVCPDDLEVLESVSNAVSGMNSKNIESRDNLLPISCTSLEKTNMLEVRSPFFLPHLLFNKDAQMEKQASPAENSKQTSPAENSKQTHISGSILQKWVPVGIRDPDLASSVRHGISSFEHSGGPAAEDWTLRSTVEEKVAASSQNLVYPLKAGTMCSSQNSGNLNCCAQEDESQIQKLRGLNACILEENKNKHVAANCRPGEFKDHNVSAPGSDLNKIARAVNDACRVQLASEAVQMAIGCPVAEFERLLHFCSPVICHSNNLISCKTCLQDQIEGTFLCRHEGPNISLGCLWRWYEKHGSYGLEVRAEDHENPKRLGVDCFAFRAYFVPYLSAVQLFKNCKSHSIKNKTSEKTYNVGHLPIYSLLVPKPRTSNTSIPLSVNEACKPESYSVSSKESSSVRPVDMTRSGDPELLFEYFESEQPHRRQPLYDKIQELVRGDVPSQCKMYGDPTKLNTINLHELHPGSWLVAEKDFWELTCIMFHLCFRAFRVKIHVLPSDAARHSNLLCHHIFRYSVAWYPIYRIPDGKFRAAFLTYHSLGHLVRRTTKFDYPIMDASIVSPVVGLQSYNAQGECWFRLRPSALSQRAESQGLNPSGILKERLKTLEETASLMARAVVNKRNLTSINRHPDYEFFLSRRR